jgi:hypothetical protein
MPTREATTCVPSPWPPGERTELLANPTRTPNLRCPMRAIRASTMAFVMLPMLIASLASPTAAAKPTREVIDIGTPADEAEVGAIFTELCGFPLTASIESRVTVFVFTDRHGEFKRELDIYASMDTLLNAAGGSVTLHDIGPDVFWLSRDGELLYAAVGRSLTGSGYIGRVVVNLDTGEELLVAGKNVGSLEDQVCEPLAT